MNSLDYLCCVCKNREKCKRLVDSIIIILEKKVLTYQCFDYVKDTKEVEKIKKELEVWK